VNDQPAMGPSGVICIAMRDFTGSGLWRNASRKSSSPADASNG
jgi:hypothetical protein